MSYTPPVGNALTFSFSSAAGYTPPAGNALTFEFGTSGGTPGAVASSAVVLEAVSQSSVAATSAALAARVASGAAALAAVTGAAVAKVLAQAIGSTTLADVVQAAMAGMPQLQSVGAVLLDSLVSSGSAETAALTEPNLPRAMKPANFPLNVLQGANYTRTITWKVGDPAGPVDFSGCTARAQIRTTVQAKNVLLEMTTENGRLALGGPAGTLTIDLDEAATSQLPAGDAVYDLELVYPVSGRVVRLMAGIVRVNPQVTR